MSSVRMTLTSPSVRPFSIHNRQWWSQNDVGGSGCGCVYGVTGASWSSVTNTGPDRAELPLVMTDIWTPAIPSWSDAENWYGARFGPWNDAPCSVIAFTRLCLVRLGPAA